MTRSPIVADRRWAEQLFRAHLFLLGSENTFTTKDAKSTKEFVATDFVLFVFFVVQSTAHPFVRKSTEVEAENVSPTSRRPAIPSSTDGTAKSNTHADVTFTITEPPE